MTIQASLTDLQFFLRKNFPHIMLLSLFILILIFCSCQQTGYINQKDFTIKNAVYIIRNREGNVNLEFNNEIKFINTRKNLKQNFELIPEKNKTNNLDIY